MDSNKLESRYLDCYEVEQVRDIAIFCIARRGRCWPGWSANKIFKYLAWHYLAGTLFTTDSADNTDGKRQLTGVAIAWLAKEQEIKAREVAREPQFNWRLPWPGKALVIAEVFGDERTSAELWFMALKRWPQVTKTFTYRAVPFSNRIALKEYEAARVTRFLSRALEGGCHGRR